MEWIYFDDKLPKEEETAFNKLYGTDKWVSGVMFRTARYNLLFTIEHKGKRIVVNGKMIDGEPMCDYERLHSDAKYIAWMPYPEPIID